MFITRSFRWIRRILGRYRPYFVWFVVTPLTVMGLTLTAMGTLLPILDAIEEGKRVFATSSFVVTIGAWFLFLGGGCYSAYWLYQIYQARSLRQRDAANISPPASLTATSLALTPAVKIATTTTQEVGPSRPTLYVVAGEQFVRNSIALAANRSPPTAFRRVGALEVRNQLTETIAGLKLTDSDWRQITSRDCAKCLMIIEEVWHAELNQVPDGCLRLHRHLELSAQRARSRDSGVAPTTLERQVLRKALAETHDRWPRNPNVKATELNEALAAVNLADSKTAYSDGPELCRVHTELFNLQRLRLGQQAGMPDSRIHAEFRETWYRLRDRVRWMAHRQDEATVQSSVDVNIALEEDKRA